MKLDDNLKQTMTFYCELMQEIKIRDQAVAELTNSNIPAQIAYESSYLQLRFMCELLSIACLVAHGDVPAVTQKMKKSWDANEIIKRLGEIHADFYPHPVRASAKSHLKLDDVTDSYLEKSDLLSLYGKCGDRLHRGTAKNARHRINPHNVSFTQIQNWRMRFVNLLRHHWIKLYGSDDQIGVQMMALNQGVEWNYWSRLAGPPPGVEA